MIQRILKLWAISAGFAGASWFALTSFEMIQHHGAIIQYEPTAYILYPEFFMAFIGSFLLLFFIFDFLRKPERSKN